MTFGQAIQSGFSQYVKFSGRASVREFWYWVLFLVICGIATSIIDAFLFPSLTLVSPLNDIFAIATLLPSLSVAARRLHDTERSGWWLLLLLIPIVGTIVLIVWWIQKGVPDVNEYGPAPKE
jgi:uncharacterized membrane protein YhaH (DUF805 family)